MNKFELALRAQIPIIRVSTNDIINVKSVIEYLTGQVPRVLTVSKDGYISTTVLPKSHHDQGVYLYTGIHQLPGLDVIYSTFARTSSSLVLVNQKEDISAYDAGIISTPLELIESFLVPEYMGIKEATGILPSLGGLTLKEVTEVLTITQAREGGIDIPGVIRTRQEFGSSIQGLELVSTIVKGYVPNADLQQVANFEKQFFLGDHDNRLRPRGILAKGQAGTGKSLGAKFLARQWGVPLFRLDATVQGKFVGESESNLAQALQRVEALSPAIILFDEIEKLFAGNDSSGVTTKMLGSLLWWLQEHKEKVFTFMTCNDISGIPKELYRAGRIDRVMEFKGLTKPELIPFIRIILKSFKVSENIRGDLAREIYKKLTFDTLDKTFPHAQVQAVIIQVLKSRDFKPEKSTVDSKKKKKVR